MSRRNEQKGLAKREKSRRNVKCERPRPFRVAPGSFPWPYVQVPRRSRRRPVNLLEAPNRSRVMSKAICRACTAMHY